MFRPWTAFGVGLLVAGVVGAAVVVLSLPELPLSACTDVGYVGEPPGGFEFYGFDFGRVVYTPDGGVNRCSSPAVPIVGACLGIGTALLAHGQGRR